MTTIVVFEKPFQHGVANAFSRELREAMAGVGFTVRPVDVTSPDLADRYTALTREPVALAIGFNGAGYCAEVTPGLNFFEAHGIPFLWIAIDHPAYMGSVFNSAGLLASVVDRTHVAYRERYTGNNGRTFFLPHGASLCSEPERLRAVEAPHRYPVMFAGGGGKPAAILAQWRKQHHSSLVGLLQDVGDFVAARSGAVLESVLSDGVSAAGLARDDPQHLPYINALFPSVDGYVRRSRRQRLLAALDAAGIAVDLIGPGWDQHGFRHHRVHAPQSYLQVLAAMVVSDVVLNVGPNFPAGSHERVLSGMANGALVFTDETAYFNEAFAVGEELVSFRWQNLDEGVERLSELLHDAPGREAIAAAGRKAAVRGHLWSHRAVAVIERLKPLLGNLG